MLPKRCLILLVLGALMPLAALLAACDVLPQNPNVSKEPTLTPTATLDPSGYQAVAPLACLVNDWQTVQSERKAVGQVHWQQGSLMAWQPGGQRLLDPEEGVQGSGTRVAGSQATVPAAVTPSAIAAAAGKETPLAVTPSAAVTLPPAVTAPLPSKTPSAKNSAGAGRPQRVAYLIPSERTSWFAGTLMIATAPDFADRKELAPNILVAGDLTWSPGGTWLAFLAFRPNENLYTVMAVQADGSGLTDLFPTDLARTDARTSQKAVLGWKDDSTVQVIASCGEECRSGFDITLGGALSASAGIGAAAEPALTPTPIDNYHTLSESLAIERHTLTFDPTTYPKNMLDPTVKNNPLLMKSQPNWSPDETMVDYLDKKGILWLLSIPDKINYMLDIGLRDVIETQWAADNHYLSVRAEDRIFVFQIPCDTKK